MQVSVHRFFILGYVFRVDIALLFGVACPFTEGALNPAISPANRAWFLLLSLESF